MNLEKEIAKLKLPFNILQTMTPTDCDCESGSQKVTSTSSSDEKVAEFLAIFLGSFSCFLRSSSYRERSEFIFAIQCSFPNRSVSGNTPRKTLQMMERIVDWPRFPDKAFVHKL